MRGRRIKSKDQSRRRLVWERVSASDAAMFLGVSVRTIDRMVDRGTLTAYRTEGGHRRFSVAELRRERARRSPAKPRQLPTRKAPAHK